MNKMDQLASELQKIIDGKDSSRKQAYDTKAKVVRIDDDGVVWVNIPGGVSETPVERTNNANVGDDVMVRVSGGRAYLLGNSTDPAAGTRAVNIVGEVADHAVRDAEKAQSSADAAFAAASDAYASAREAETQAASATNSANAAVTQLGIVEDVVGVLSWISEHATYKASTDTEVVAGKMYFTLSGGVYTPVASPTGNPSTAGYYEIDDITEAVSNYVSSHLSLTNAGLWVVNDNSSYKILLSSTGMKVYDASGNLVSTFGESITFSSTRQQVIGGQNNYILFNPTDGSLTISGNNVKIGNTGKKLSEVLTMDSIEVGGTNLFLETPRADNHETFAAFDIDLTVLPKAGETFTVQLWDVSVSHTGKDSSGLGVSLYWGGGNVSLAEWKGTDHFTNGFAEHLTATFTITAAQAEHADAENRWFRLYNSAPSAEGTMNMSVGQWKLERGNIPTAWSPAPEDVSAEIAKSGKALSEDIERVETDTNARIDDANTDFGDFRTKTEADLDVKIDTVEGAADASLLANIQLIADLLEFSANIIKFTKPDQSITNLGQEFGKLVQYVTIDPSVPSITVGNPAGMHIVITNTNVNFVQGSNTVGHLTGDELYVQNKLSFGNFQFYQRNNGHFTLKLL